MTSTNSTNSTESANTLLVATDFSLASLHAVDRALLLAARTGANCVVMHAVEMSDRGGFGNVPGNDAFGMTQKITGAVRDALASLVQERAAQHGVAATSHLEEGPPARALADYAGQIDAGLIVIGAHGRGFLHRFLLGSTAARLLRRVRRPVLIVKKPAQTPYKKVVVAVDFSAASGRCIREARAIAPHVPVLLVHVYELPYEGKMRFAGITDEVIDKHHLDARHRLTKALHDLARSEGLDSADYTATVLYATSSVVGEIAACARKNRCDLIVLGKHGANLAEHLLLGSVSSSLLAEARSDVLIVTHE